MLSMLHLLYKRHTYLVLLYFDKTQMDSLYNLLARLDRCTLLLDIERMTLGL